MGKDTYSLFSDVKFNAKKYLKGNHLKIVAGRNRPLSKNQQTFNKLTRRIEQLQNTIKRETVKLESLLKFYLTEIPEKKKVLANNLLAVAKALGHSTKVINYRKRQYEHLRDVILCLCNEAFSYIEPDEETELFYDAWSESSYREELQSQGDLSKQTIAERVNHIFGVEIDPDEIDDTPEGFARFAKRLQDEFFDNGNAQEGHFSKRKATKKQRKREKLRKLEAELTLKSIRSIYLSLAKVLHPDTIVDPAEKSRKEELMKKVTAAYADKDLPTLLKLEMEWVASESAALDTLPDDKLKLYIASFREQLAVLEQEHAALYYHPRFMSLSEFARYPESKAQQLIREQARDYDRVIGGLSEIMAILSKPTTKKEIMELVREYRETINSRNPFLEEFMSDIF
ncbi:MAG: J domain-containing protein [Thermodesulfovibrionales bacterium]|jgi:hypothetical protein